MSYECVLSRFARDLFVDFPWGLRIKMIVVIKTNGHPDVYRMFLNGPSDPSDPDGTNKEGG